LAYGLWQGLIQTQTSTLLAIFFGVIASEYACIKVNNRYQPVQLRLFKSSLITCLSLCLLLRVADPAFGLLAGSLAIVSKLLSQHRGHHWFNPTNFAIVVCSLAFEGVWVSLGQWGHNLWLALCLSGAGLLVSSKASRWDTALWFIASYTGILFARAWWLGDPWNIPLHQMHNSALLLFAFFMLTDPKTSPSHPQTRFFYAVGIALMGSYFQFIHFIGTGLFYGLFLMCCTVPLLNFFWPAPRYQWPQGPVPK
jgi:Na+-transporting NADH:ubiquinone oxidoreductase subunit NqrB